MSRNCWVVFANIRPCSNDTTNLATQHKNKLTHANAMGLLVQLICFLVWINHARGAGEWQFNVCMHSSWQVLPAYWSNHCNVFNYVSSAWNPMTMSFCRSEILTCIEKIAKLIQVVPTNPTPEVLEIIWTALAFQWHSSQRHCPCSFLPSNVCLRKRYLFHCRILSVWDVRSELWQWRSHQHDFSSVRQNEPGSMCEERFWKYRMCSQCSSRASQYVSSGGEWKNFPCFIL